MSLSGKWVDALFQFDFSTRNEGNYDIFKKRKSPIHLIAKACFLAALHPSFLALGLDSVIVPN